MTSRLAGLRQRMLSLPRTYSSGHEPTMLAQVATLDDVEALLACAETVAAKHVHRGFAMGCPVCIALRPLLVEETP